MSLKVILKNQGSTNFFTVAYKLAYASKNLDENMCINSLVLNGFLLKISALFFFWEMPISQYLLRVYLWYQSNILKRYFCKSSVYKVNWTVQILVQRKLLICFSIHLSLWYLKKVLWRSLCRFTTFLMYHKELWKKKKLFLTKCFEVWDTRTV